MIDAGPSLRAAEGLSGAALAAYLLSRGWTARPSRVQGVSILSKDVEGADRPALFVLPVASGFTDEHRRVADGLRTVAAVEETTVEEIADQARRASLYREPESPVGVAVRAWRELDAKEFEEELYRLLGIKGPMGSVAAEGQLHLVYRMPDGGEFFLEPPDRLTAEQRSAIIQDIQRRVIASGPERWRYEVLIQELQAAE